MTEGEHRRFWVVAIVLAGVHLAAFTAEFIDSSVAIRRFPDCDVYCGVLTLPGALLLLPVVAGSFLGAIVFSLLALIQPGRSRVVGAIGLLVCLATATVLALQVMTHFATS
jgi:hypothetical protein